MYIELMTNQILSNQMDKETNSLAEKNHRTEQLSNSFFSRQIHLQQFCDTRYAPFLPTSPAHVVAPSTSPAAHSSSAPLPVTPPDTPDASTYLKKNRCDTSGNWAPGKITQIHSSIC